MLNIEKWAQGRPRILSILAHTNAIFSEKLYSDLTAIINGDYDRKDYPLVPLDEWLYLYKNHRRIWGCIQEMMVGDLSVHLDNIQLVDSLPPLDEGNPENLHQEFNHFVTMHNDHFEEAYQQNIADILADIRDETGQITGSGPDQGHNNRSNDDRGYDPGHGHNQNQGTFVKPPSEAVPVAVRYGKSGLDSGTVPDLGPNISPTCLWPEAQFLVRIWIPCFNLYGTDPVHLIRSARSGNIEALDRLFRLDKSTIFDPKISKFMYQLCINNKSRYDSLIDALKKPPKGTISQRKIKVSLAAFISLIFEGLGHKLTEPEIRDLFDCLAKDYGRGDIDTDLPDSPDAFSKAVRRERPFWILAMRSEKNNFFLSE